LVGLTIHLDVKRVCYLYVVQVVVFHYLICIYNKQTSGFLPRTQNNTHNSGLLAPLHLFPANIFQQSWQS
jgi:hypothetical protein